MGDGNLFLARSEKGFDTTGARVKADALKEANQYCAKSGKKLELIKVSQNDMVPFKSDAQAELEFKCIPQ